MSLSEAEFAEIRDRMVRNAGTDSNTPRPGTPKRSKFGNIKKVVDNIQFDSSAEARRYIELKAMQSAGQIANLELQPNYVLLEKFTDATGRKYRALTYTADFRYLDGGGHTVAEDVKGYPTEAFKIRWKLAIKKYPLVRFELIR